MRVEFNLRNSFTADLICGDVEDPITVELLTHACRVVEEYLNSEPINWEAAPEDPGCAYYARDGGYTCIETDAVHNAVRACERCILKAGYTSVAARNLVVG